ncbi:MAG: hypothetical protein C6W54_00155 [Bacillaceae bacterium]|mgnify:FL=1|uniref:YaaC family protein n=1 Tax=Aeribacillus TaxID=1055323 RepID=UPI000E36D4FE|nr:MULTISPECIES: YaaC family protein [Aeribacillus]REJ27272.1 MAG: hypothetical protein C6W54_00155 [Bacillaceae bacterium]RZI50520.1 hypothetical protein EW027_14945 [Aeribacillus pallidus]TVZ75919.1 YaaC-like protein [Aeribacillus composti]
MSIWNFYSSFHSAQTVQRLLTKHYQKLNVHEPEQTSYQNCYTFIYFLKHGENYYKMADTAPIMIKPVLAFYGISQLIKALLLTVDARYPSSSAVLSHGVSTRKRKKHNYNFLKDEVKVQKNGLYRHAALNLFQLNHTPGEKFSMDSLLKRIPELSDLYQFHLQIPTTIPIETNDTFIIVHKEIANRYCITSKRLAEILQSQLHWMLSNEDVDSLYFSHSAEFHYLWKSSYLFNFYNKQYYLPAAKEDIKLMPEILIHYLVLYNLSMISRYETEWLYDLMYNHHSDDYVFIHQFMEITLKKIPWLTLMYLNHIFNG